MMLIHKIMVLQNLVHIKMLMTRERKKQNRQRLLLYPADETSAKMWHLGGVHWSSTHMHNWAMRQSCIKKIAHWAFLAIRQSQWNQQSKEQNLFFSCHPCDCLKSYCKKRLMKQLDHCSPMHLVGQVKPHNATCLSLALFCQTKKQPSIKRSKIAFSLLEGWELEHARVQVIFNMLGTVGTVTVGQNVIIDAAATAVIITTTIVRVVRNFHKWGIHNV